MATRLSDLISSATGDEYGLTAAGVRDVVSERCAFDGYNTTRSFLSVVDMYQVLIVRGRVDTDDLEELFRPFDNHAPDQGQYAELAFDQWFDDVGAPNLRKLPGVRIDEQSGVATFDGGAIDPDAYPDEHVQPLDELRNDPAARAGIALDRLGYDRGDDDREQVLELYHALLDRGTATADELETVHRTTPLETHADTLAKLPGVERSTEPTPEPDELSIDTYQDVLDAREAVESEPVVEWTVEPSTNRD